MSTANPTERFSDRVADYVRFRPSYPDALIDALVVRLGLSRGKALADVGSGTGISAKLFLERGIEVWAVEPNAGMREAAEEALGGFPGFHSVAATAEATTLPDRSIDAAVAFQAFHWFDGAETRTELLRILRGTAPVALVWNERLVDTPFLVAYEDLLQRRSTDYASVRHRNAYDRIAAFFAPTVPDELVFANEQVLDRDALLGRVFSSSYVPKVGPEHDAFRVELLRIFEAHEVSGEVSFRYETRAFVGGLA